MIKINFYDYSSEPHNKINFSTPTCNFLNSLCYARAENLTRIVTVIKAIILLEFNNRMCNSM